MLPEEGAEICRKAARAAWIQVNQVQRGLWGPSLQKQGTAGVVQRNGC